MSNAAERREPRRDRDWWLLLILEIVVAANAIGGGIYGLLGAEGVPPEWLEGSPFETYAIPSLVLLVVVGGSMGVAAAALLRDDRRAPELSVFAGVVLLVWLAIEMLIIPLSWLQPAFLVVALLVIGLGLRARAD